MHERCATAYIRHESCSLISYTIRFWSAHSCSNRVVKQGRKFRFRSHFVGFVQSSGTGICFLLSSSVVVSYCSSSDFAGGGSHERCKEITYTFEPVSHGFSVFENHQQRVEHHCSGTSELQFGVVRTKGTYICQSARLRVVDRK